MIPSLWCNLYLCPKTVKKGEDIITIIGVDSRMEDSKKGIFKRNKTRMASDYLNYPKKMEKLVRVLKDN